MCIFVILDALFFSLGFNAFIKRLVTFRETLPIEEFIRVVLVDMTAELSNDYRVGKRANRDKPEIKLDQWTEAAHWLSDAQYLTYSEEDMTKEFYIKSSKIDNDITFDIENVEKLRNQNFKSLDQYINDRHGSFWTLKLNKSDWMNFCRILKIE